MSGGVDKKLLAALENEGILVLPDLTAKQLRQLMRISGAAPVAGPLQLTARETGRCVARLVPGKHGVIDSSPSPQPPMKTSRRHQLAGGPTTELRPCV